MKIERFTMLFAGAALALCGAFAHAQEAEKRPDTLDLTMVLLPEHASGPEEVTRRIELPPAPDASKPPAPRTDDAAPREDKPEPRDDAGKGGGTAEEARERGRDSGKDVAEQARENRENAGHGNNGNNGGDGSNPGNGPRDGRPPPSPPGRP